MEIFYDLFCNALYSRDYGFVIPIHFSMFEFQWLLNIAATFVRHNLKALLMVELTTSHTLVLDVVSYCVPLGKSPLLRNFFLIPFLLTIVEQVG